ncbi:MAG: TRAP transporter small permease subunit [Alphaproteobacteria bacterium]|nr:TRAP transporter small permease subunit [Alphaproteobacteria bacterium]
MLARLVAAIERAVAALTALLLAAIVLANAAEIVSRGVFSHSILWLYESNLLIANWLYFLGMCLVYARHKDITLDFILYLVRGRARPLYLIAVNLVGIGTFAVIGWYGVVLMRLQLPFRTTGYGIPNALFTLPLVLACGFIGLIIVKQSLDIWHSGDLPVHAAEAEDLEA